MDRAGGLESSEAFCLSREAGHVESSWENVIKARGKVLFNESLGGYCDLNEKV